MNRLNWTEYINYKRLFHCQLISKREENVPTISDWLITCTITEPIAPFFDYSRSLFPIAGVSSRSKMYRTSAASDLHSDLHFAQKNKMYAIHFAQKNYTLILKP